MGAGIDTAKRTKLLTEGDILSDLNSSESVNKDGDYYNCLNITDNYVSDRPLYLRIDEEFVPETTRLCVTMEKTIRVSEYVDATPEQMQMIYDGENPFFD